jgi:nucleotidyltransferase/DNA polymerase involved in DNA repair
VEAMMIVHLRVVPGFWVAVEESRRPDLRSGPLIIGGLPQQRGIVREANQLAQQSGVRPGMTLSQAHQQCPHGVFLLPDLARYERIWEEVCDILRGHTPLVEPVEMGQAACDMSGCERFWSDERSAGRIIARQIEGSTGIAPSLGMASNKLVAQLASMFTEADGVTVIDRGRERAFLADLPLTLLPRVDARLALTFQVLGLTTIGQFAALPSSAVKQRFGATGEQLHRYARGIDPRPVLSPPEKSSIVTRYECEDGSIEEAMDGLRTLADTCAGELLRRRAAGRLVGLTVTWTEESMRVLPDRKPPVRMESSEPPALPAPKKQLMPCRPEDERRTLPIPYRVHSSRLPQPFEEPVSGAPTLIPGPSPAPREKGDACGYDVSERDMPAASFAPRSETIGRSQQMVAMVRTPIETAPPLLERAQRLLLQSWPRVRSTSGEGDRRPRLLAIELKIGEFTKPSQLSLSDFDRLDGGGMLKGLSAERRQALTHHDEVFEARYGTTAFQHVAGVDSGNILTERRFRWEAGLPWTAGAVQKRSS